MHAQGPVELTQRHNGRQGRIKPFKVGMEDIVFIVSVRCLNPYFVGCIKLAPSTLASWLALGLARSAGQTTSPATRFRYSRLVVSCNACVSLIVVFYLECLGMLDEQDSAVWLNGRISIGMRRVTGNSVSRGLSRPRDHDHISSILMISSGSDQDLILLGLGASEQGIPGLVMSPRIRIGQPTERVEMWLSSCPLLL